MTAPILPQVVLEQTLQLRVFERSILKVRFWLKSRAEEQLASRCDIGTRVEEAQGILDQHEKFEARARVRGRGTHQCYFN